MFGERSIDAARASFSSRARLSGSDLSAAGRNFSATGPAEPDVLGAIHLAHAAGAQAFADPVVLDGCADHISGFETRGLARSSPPSPSILIRNGITELRGYANGFRGEVPALTPLSTPKGRAHRSNRQNGRPDHAARCGRPSARPATHAVA